ncbi:diguanylate cyclase/phosphodiesterase (GGDEF & EAL domains) with PAS/PAC sensor(s) [hydrothermal vent metagenome]|uniref:Diguanylate cyclase/phosphodiesterase (GGDEF & EAL domains) with PAS/PAC sensor(S) n=1 Tax=hydrothermal vent metagenome TaxID=652676 RepID=A0A3B1C0R5_9ZZZZ
MLNRFFVVFLPGSILVAGMLGFVYYSDAKSIRFATEYDETHHIGFQSGRIGSSFQHVASDLLFLAEDHELQKIKPVLKDIEDDWISFLSRRGIYDQLRFIGLNGREVLRANYNNAKPYVVSLENLQDKSLRYYYKEALKLKRGEIYISSFDLNVEGGEVELPRKPVIRFATPVFQEDGTQKGILVLNFLGSRLLDGIKKLASNVKGEVWFLNSGGYYLVGPKPEVEWGFMFKGKEDEIFQALFPEAWKKISLSDTLGQFYTPKGLFTFATVHPFVETKAHNRGVPHEDEAGGGGENDEAHHFRIVSYLSADVLGHETMPLKSRTAKIFAVLLSLLAFISFILAKTKTQRIQAEDRLKLAQQKNSAIIKTVGEGIIAIDDDSIIQYVNRELLKIFGYEREDLENRHISMLMPEKYRAGHGEGMKIYLETATAKVLGRRIEIEGLHKNGTVFPIELRIEETKVDETHFFTAAIRDITERKAIENEIKRQKTMFESIFNGVTDAIVLTDTQRKIVLTNKGFTKILGYTLQDVIGKETGVFYESWDVYKKMGEERYNLSAEEKLKPYAVHYKRKDGTVFIGETVGTIIRNQDGAIAGFLGMIRDITERDRVEAALRNIAMGVVAVTGDEFFHKMTLYLQGTLNVKYVLIGIIDKDDPLLVNVISLCANGERAELFSYSLAGTPCHEVAKSGICCYPSGVADKFPEDALLADMGIESYVGAPVKDEAGNVVGLVVLLDTKPLVNEDISKSNLTISADRIAAEIKRKQDEAELKKTNRMLRMISDSNQTLIRSVNERKLLNDVCRIIVNEGGYRLVWVGCAEQDEEKSIHPVAQAGFEDGYLKTLNITWADTEHGQGPTGMAIRTAKPHVTRDILTDPAFAPWRADALKRGYASSIAIPLIINSEAVGTINIYSAKPDAFDTQEVSLLVELVDDLAYGINTLRTQEKHKKAEKELDRLHLAIEQAAETVVITDTEGKIEYVNPAFERVSGYTKEEAIGQNPRVLKSGKHNEAFYKKLWDTVTSGKTWSGHFVNKNKNGNLYEEDATISPIIDSSGTITGYVAAKRDITRELLLEKQFRETQKMEAIGTLAGGIAHDFNNILFAILGYSTMVVEDLPEGSGSRENLEEVIRAARRAKELVQQILTFSRQSEQEFQPTHMGAIVNEAINLLTVSIPPNIEVRLGIDRKHDSILADPTQIHQVVMNLCTNALHAMRDISGVLEVSLGGVEIYSDLATTIAGLREGPYILLSVSDTGHGIKSETAERIFEPFFTTKEVGEGTGLGLAAVHGIVTSHGGAISVKSEHGKGATFNVYLPSTELVSQGEPEKAMLASHGDERVLVVDDEEPIARLVKQILERLGYDAVAMGNSVDALEHFMREPGKFDLVITDQSMPDMTGEAMVRAMLTIRPDIPVIIMTGFSKTITPEKMEAIGVTELLLKPIIPNDLGKVVRRVLDQPKKEG